MHRFHRRNTRFLSMISVHRVHLYFPFYRTSLSNYSTFLFVIREQEEDVTKNKTSGAKSRCTRNTNVY